MLLSCGMARSTEAIRCMRGALPHQKLLLGLVRVSQQAFFKVDSKAAPLAK